jgi:hypothetical protein
LPKALVLATTLYERSALGLKAMWFVEFRLPALVLGAVVGWVVRMGQRITIMELLTSAMLYSRFG